MEYTVYLRTNTVNNKQYVGQTSDFKSRQWDWNCLKKTYANEYLSDDRAKYGFDAWTVETLAKTDSREEAWELEQRFIKDYNTLWPNGYNISEGGAGAKYWIGKQLTDEHKEKISEALKIPVYQYTLDGKLVAIWKSATDAAEKLGIERSNISACCHGRLKTAGGYIWSFIPL